LFDPEMVAGLQMLIERLERDDQVKVVVFDSANPDFFISHIDLTRVWTEKSNHDSAFGGRADVR
jgi:enoyl-CoA hydratase/carnithine racemase